MLLGFCVKREHVGKPEEAVEQYTCETNTGRQTPVLPSFVLSMQTIRLMEARLL